MYLKKNGHAITCNRPGKVVYNNFSLDLTKVGILLLSRRLKLRLTPETIDATELK